MGLFAPSRIMRPNQLRDSDNASSTTLLFARRIYVFSPSENPNGIPSQCPGLRGTSYPGSSAKKPPQPQRGCDPCAPARAPGLGLNAVGVYLFTVVELVALRRVAPRPAAQRLPANGAVRASRSAAARGGVVAARQPLPLNRYRWERAGVRVSMPQKPRLFLYES